MTSSKSVRELNMKGGIDIWEISMREEQQSICWILNLVIFLTKGVAIE
jgi:hypothetical protein